MTSSTVAGERRWASARRGGMTVLGKVAVPKPLNLPSQRLENHGLDPNVEIVPKGTLSWGARCSSSATNAWSTSALAPSPDNSTNSPSHLSGRPSSGGSGTQPLTAGNDRPIEPTGNAWGPNSRPSSASGVLASNQSSLTSLRPRSAESRPASSQLSRFGEPVSDSPGAWGGNSTTERLGVVSSKKDDFSLSSGDFPTLGSEKDYPGKSTESKDPGSHGRPSSASGRVAHAKDKTVTSHADDPSGAANTGKDGSQIVGDGIQPSMEKWQGEPQHYINPNVPPQHFDAWRGPSMNAPAGVWYTGPPGTLPYGSPVGPGGFPIEPFPYYHPQIPPPSFANSQPVPPPRAGPRAHHPKSGNPFRPPIPHAYVHPGMPFRPGFYPAPMAFEGYHRPPMGFGNSNERDTPFVGMGACPAVYDRYTSPSAPDPIDSYARAGWPASAVKTMSDDVEPAHSGDARGSYKVLLRQHNEWDGEDQGENRGHLPAANASPPIKGEKAGIKLRKYEWGAEDNEEEDIYPSHNFENRGSCVSDAAQEKYSESSINMNPAVDCLINKSESVISSSSQMPQVSTDAGTDSAFSSRTKDATLMQNIQGLNVKVLASDEKVDYASSGEEHNWGSNAANDSSDMSTNKASKLAVSSEGASVAPTSQEVVVSAGDNIAQPTAAISRRPYHVMPSRTNHHVKGKFSNQDAGGRRRMLNPSPVSSSKVEPSCNLQDCDHHQVVEAAGINHPAKDEGESVLDLHDSTDNQAQRAKMRELAKQCAIQLQKEEEGRIREQKAKALAKLEELNRRMLSGDASNQTAKRSLASVTSQEEQVVREMESIESVTKVEASNLVSPLKPEEVSRINKNSGNQVVGSAIPSKALPVETSKSMKLESIPRDESVPSKKDVVNANTSDTKSASQLNEGGPSKHKRTSYKQKQISTMQKNSNEKSIPDGASEAQKHPVNISFDFAASNVVASSAVNSSDQPHLPNNSFIVPESSGPLRRKSNKSNKHNNKQNGAPYIPTLTANVRNESVTQKTSDEDAKSLASNFDLNTGSIQRAINKEIGLELSEQCSILPSEEAHGRVNNQGKPQHSRRTPRNQQVNRFVDKSQCNDAVIWAPVRSQNKAEDKAEAAVGGDQKPIAISVTPSKCDNLVQNSSKSKRAELERYVPKPVAKELAQLAGMQQPESSSGNISTSDETFNQQPLRSETGKIGSSVEFKEGVTRPNKHVKGHGAWRRQGSTELLNAKHVLQGSSSTSDPSKSSQEAILKNRPLNPGVDSAEAERKTSTELNAFDSQIVSDNSDSPATDSSVPKDQLVTGKGKGHPYRGHRNIGNRDKIDNKNVSSAETDRTHFQSPASDVNQSDSGIASKETRGIGELMSSQWQPKSVAPSASSQRGSRVSAIETVGSGTSRAIKDYPHQRVKTPPQNDVESNEINRPLHNQCVSETKEVTEVLKARNHDPRRERKSTSSIGRPYFPNQNPVGADESASAVNTHAQHDQQFSAGSRRYGTQISRSGRGQSRGDWSGHDNRQLNIPMNQDRQGHSVHYEYQPVGSYNNTKSNNFEAQGDGSQYAGRRYREKGRSHLKRVGGNFHGQEGGSLHLDAGCD